MIYLLLTFVFRKQLSAMEFSKYLDNQSIQQIFKQWIKYIDPNAINNASDALRNIVLIGFQLVDDSDTPNEAHDMFFNLYTDLHTVNIDFSTNYNIGNSIDLIQYNFVFQHRSSNKKTK